MGRKPKNLWTDQGLGDPIVRYHADDEGDEAQWVARQIALLHDEDHRRWGDVAVFYRTNAQSRVLEEHLMRVGIPYKVLGGTGSTTGVRSRMRSATCVRSRTPLTK